MDLDELDAAADRLDRSADLRVGVGRLDQDARCPECRVVPGGLQRVECSRVVAGPERDRVGGDRRLELARGTDRGDPPVVDDRDPVGDLGLVHVMGREQHRQVGGRPHRE